MQHPELGRKILDRVAEEVSDLGRVEVTPRQDGRNMTMVLGPDKKAQAAAQRKQQADEAARAAEESIEESESDAPTVDGNAVDIVANDEGVVDDVAEADEVAEDVETDEVVEGAAD